MVDADARMTYLAVEWRHDGADDPTMLYSELDGDRWEVRKVEVYADGRMDFADAERETGSTWLGEKVMPSVEEINSLGPFTARSVSRDDFERVWTEALARRLDNDP